ncbi:MAG: hypothetical protein KBD83_02115 [Gammaproteobacteria bacterium]|nr:hypothetical protein [Gammaproteobacteria bacterium]
MNRRSTILFIAAYAYVLCAYGINYSCEIFKGTEKIMTLPGSLPDTNTIGQSVSGRPIDPNIALSYTLCQQAGFKLISVQTSIPGMRSSTRVTKIQQYPNPLCTLKCTPA